MTGNGTSWGPADSARMPGPQFHAAEQNLELQTLRDLVDTILLADYRDRNGVGLLNNIAFLQAKALVELGDTLGTSRSGDH